MNDSEPSPYTQSLRLLYACAAFLVVTHCGCGTSGKPPKASSTADIETGTSLLARTYTIAEPPSGDAPLFEKLDVDALGVDFSHQWNPANEYEAALLKTAFTGGGVSAGDYDGDGRCDLFFTRPHGGPRLLRNLGKMTFEDVTESAGIKLDSYWATGSVMADLNNDGHLDLLVAGYDQNVRALLNDGHGQFTDVSRQCGLDFRGATVKVALADYDGDGDLDAYCLTNRLEPRVEPKIRFTREGRKYGVAPEHRELAGVINLPGGEQKFVKAGQYDHLFQNQLVETGKLGFVEVTEKAGIEGNYHGLDVAWWDFNADGAPDLYVANDFTDPDQLFRNNGDGTFTDVAADSLPNTPWFTMASAVCDVNRDGRFDLLTADMAATTHHREVIAMDSVRSAAWFLDTAEPRQYMRNALYLNTGTPRFMEIGFLAGVASSDWTWSTKVADMDNDGREDFFITNGFTRDYLNSDFNESLRKKGLVGDSLSWYDAPELPEANVAFRGVDDYEFRSVGGEWGVAEEGISFGSALADLDDDGDLDLVVSNFGGPPSIYRNHSQGRRVRIDLVGAASNRFGVGATVTARMGEVTQSRYVSSTNGFMSADEPGVFLGTGEQEAIDELTVRWPSGMVQSLHDVETNCRHKIVEPQQKAESQHETDNPSVDASPEPMFVPADLLTRWQRRERPYDDFAEQPLLPWKLSQLGPGMAWADVDGDGDVDVFLGGAAGQESSLLLREGDGFRELNVPAFGEHAEHEDMGCLFVDADRDGDLDLFVVSGGVESATGDARLRDRLYINDATEDELSWRLAENALPDIRDSGSAAVSFDFDRDGDHDLVVGGRVVPGAYPTAPATRLLRNDDGRFVEVTNELAPQLAAAGMVTGVVAADIDRDGWTDLLLAVEYGPIRVFSNRGGRLVETTEAAGTGRLLGYWNSILAGDVDGDGDVDFAVGNLGRNSRYQPTPNRPQRLFYGDFGDGQDRIVEAKSEGQRLLPVRGKSDTIGAMPFLAERFPTFQKFAEADLTEIYTEDRLQGAMQLQATTVDSGILLNNGAGEFSFRPLPRLAQAAPIFGMAFLYANDDAHIDLFVAQNFFGPQRTTGRMGGGLGMLLLGDGSGGFSAVESATSGLVIPQDATAAVAIDLNVDGRKDLAVALNNDRPICMLREAGAAARFLAIELRGGRGNPTGAGAAVTVEFASGEQRVAEAIFTGGYLSQAVQPLQVPVPPGDAPRRVVVRWADGSETIADVSSDAQYVEITRDPPADGAP